MPKKTAGTKMSRHKNAQTNVRLSPVGKEALQALSERHGISATAVVEMLLRDRARAEGLAIKGLTK